MSGLYLTWLVDVLRAAGCNVQESSTTNGWQKRARSSGGFPITPLGIQWHHTASSASPANDLSYMINGSSDAPIGNLLLDRTGTFWPIAAGASNTAGKGGPLTLSRGTINQDQANTQSVAIEAANNGVGEPWPIVQVDAYMAGSNAINAQLGNLPTDIFSHSLGAGDGWTDRKIDPATASGVQGFWIPRSVNSSGTWSLADMRAECAARATGTIPIPPPVGVDDMSICIFESQTNPREFNATFYAYVDAEGRSIELQWSGNGDDPAVMQRLETMRANFPTQGILLAGVRNNRLHPKHRPSDLVDSLHQWTDGDFAP